jgi:hypothetical protein
MKIKNVFDNKKLFVVLFTVLASALYFGANYWAFAQNRDKIVEKRRDFKPPADIISVKSEIGLIETDKKFSADAEWFKGLTVVVRNDSEKPMTYISVKIQFPHPNKQDGLDFVVPIGYGESPLPSRGGKFLDNVSALIMPGDTIALKLSDDDYVNVRTLLNEQGYPSIIKKIEVYVATIGFEDGSIWMGDKFYKLDKNNPGKLIPLEKKIFKSF